MKTRENSHLNHQKSDNPYQVKSLEKALLILELMIDEGRDLSITEICQKLGYGKGTVHRLLGTLRDRKFVRQYPTSKLYGLGFRTLSIGAPNRRERFLRKAMVPFLRELHLQCKETVNAAVNEYNQIRYIYRLESEEMLRISTPAGARFPVHCSATGKIFLSYLSNDDIRRILGGQEKLNKMTEQTIGTMTELIKAIEKVRKKGVAYDDEEALNGVYCVAAPILNAKDVCLAAISISTPKNRITKQKSAQFARFIAQTAKSISESIEAS